MFNMSCGMLSAARSAYREGRQARRATLEEPSRRRYSRMLLQVARQQRRTHVCV